MDGAYGVSQCKSGVPKANESVLTHMVLFMITPSLQHRIRKPRPFKAGMNGCSFHVDTIDLVRNRKIAKSIQDAGWGIFLQWLKYYAFLHNIAVIAVTPQYTSQDCSGCGERVQKTLSTRTHICPNCGLILDRDENAALNILAKALDGTVGHTGTHERVS